MALLLTLLLLCIQLSACGSSSPLSTSARDESRAYLRVNTDFQIGAFEYYVDPADRFVVLDTGVPLNLLLASFWFEDISGIVLDPTLLAEYFAEEFETDGSRRLYANGRHPEIHGFVTWVHRADFYMRHLNFMAFMDGLDRVFYDAATSQLPLHVNSDIQLPRALSEIYYEHVFRAVFEQYRDASSPLDLRALLEPIYGWPEP